MSEATAKSTLRGEPVADDKNPQPIGTITREQAIEVEAILNAQPLSAFEVDVYTYESGGETRTYPPHAVPDHLEPMFRTKGELVQALWKIANATEEKGPEIFATVRDRQASLLQSELENEAGKNNKAYRTELGILAWIQFDSGDLAGWIGSAVERLGSKRCDLPPALPGIENPENPIRRIAFFSDWATACYGAPFIAAKIEEIEAKAGGAWDLVLHGGDTYYAGREKEIQRRLISAFPQLAGGGMRRALNGNHEMYSGGQWYFDAIRAGFGQRTS